MNPSTPESVTNPQRPEPCAVCAKRQQLCVCDVLPPSSIAAKAHVLILQHPQEPDKELGSAIIAARALQHATLKVGLSWRNLSAALGQEVSPQRWGVLFLGTQKDAQGAKTGGAPLNSVPQEVVIVSPKGAPLSELTLDGIVALDGNWRQAKALWWRNPWLLKLNRVVLSPQTPSLYGKLRREPRRDSLSTLEAIGLTLYALEPASDANEKLILGFSEFLGRCKKQGVKPSAPHGSSRRHHRRRRGGYRTPPKA